MSEWVVDASVAVKWFLPEIHSSAARRLLGSGRRLLAPDLIGAEFGNVLWKKWRRRELSAADAGQILADFRRFPMVIVPSGNLLAATWGLATALERTFYDSLYLALAEHSDGRLVTADQRFFNALQASSLANRVVWVQAIP